MHGGRGLGSFLLDRAEDASRRRESRTAEAQWPEGFALSAMRPGEEPILHEVIEEAFAAEWGRPSRSFEEWQRAVFSQDSFDAALCYLVREDGRPVAAEHCGVDASNPTRATRQYERVGMRVAWQADTYGKAL
jgi:ribosomal protein S18 acetylase RimI-like enzyme